MTMSLTYNEAVSALNQALGLGIDASLEPIRALCEQMGNPQQSFHCIQVAGSNGKSSTSRMIAALLRSCGCKVGLYTSPHLVKYPERIEIDCSVVDDADFAQGVSAALEAAQACGAQATEFELLTAAALWLFAQKGVEWAVCECGLGGRWDATSVVEPQVSVITGVALEHTNILGDTFEEIATEKAAIIKPGSQAVFAYGLPVSEVFEARAREVGAPFTYADPNAGAAYAEELDLFPSYQKMNFATALLAVTRALDAEPVPQKVRAALRGLVIPGRFEVLREDPLLVIDAAHNPQSAQVLAREVKRRFAISRKAVPVVEAHTQLGKPPVPTLLLGVLADKDVRGVVKAICPLFDDIVVTASTSPRAISAQQLSRIVSEVCGKVPVVTQGVSEALGLLARTPTLATGSITVAGDVKRLFTS